MKIIRAKDYYDMSRKAANIISAQVIMKPNCVLGLATGSTPIGIYKQLIDWYNKDDLDFSEVTTVNLDEYRGLKRDDPQSYWHFMHENFFDHINIDPDRINLPDGTNLDAEEECRRYDDVIHFVGGIDLQLLGIGHDGHIGFNEPGAAFELGTHCVNLTEETIEANKRFFGQQGRCAPPGLHHGHQDNYAGPQGAAGGLRQGQGRHCQEGLLRPGYAGSAGFDPADAPGFHPRRRCGSHERAVRGRTR